MIKAAIFPGRYVQGPGALAEAGKFVAPLGKRALIVWDETVKGIISERLYAGLRESGVEPISFVFSGECSAGQLELGLAKAKEEKADVVIGAGGGKAIDLAKAIAFKPNLKMVSLPTVASNDAPTSSCTVYYTDEGVLAGYDVWAGNPHMVLVDTEVIVNAPPRWFATGIGDALATWFEAEAASKAYTTAFCGGVPTMTALALARLCYDTLMEYGVDAMRDVENKVVTPAVEKVVEANVLLSGIGWESGGLATAHTLGNSLTVLECTHPYSHGEKVAFGVITQLCLDPEIDPEERLEVVDFMIEVGLPVTFAEIGMDELSREELLAACVTLTGEGEFIHNHAFKVTAYDLFSAMIAADALGKERQEMW